MLNAAIKVRRGGEQYATGVRIYEKDVDDEGHSGHAEYEDDCDKQNQPRFRHSAALTGTRIRSAQM